MIPSLLVVEDEANIRRFVSVNLTARGFNVIEAADAEQGLEKLRASLPSALILDIRLPGISGWDFLNILSGDANLSTVPVIVLTASVANVKPVENLYRNVVQWLVKPVSASELVHAVRKALNP